MSKDVADFSKKQERTVIIAVTLGNLLEWYEIYLYVYWSPIISQLFFDSGSKFENLTSAFWVFGIGLLARPIGGIFFGRLGDLIGRKKILILSILIMTIPTFVTGLLPTYAQIGAFAPWILGIMRFLQAFPAGAELPGASCYLYESSKASERKYVTSWGSFGFQLGILISTIECYLLEKFLTPEALVQWGWRASFGVGGVIGLLSLLLRSRLHETPLFREMHSHMKVVKEPLLELFYQKRGMVLGFFFSLLCSSAFYLFTVNLPFFFSNLLGFDYAENLLILAGVLVLITFPLPLFGKLAQWLNYKKMVIFSTVGMIVLLYPLYQGISLNNIVLAGVSMAAFCLCYSCMTALIPYIFCDLFPTRCRFTCLSTSFNIADAVVGGFTPVAALYLLNYTGNPASFCWLLLVLGILSLGSFFFIKERHPTSDL